MPRPARSDTPAFRPLATALAAAGLVAAVLVLYVLRLDHVGGLIGDDAWYVVLAKAIAEGSGPRLISSAGPHLLSPVYPPGFPALLSFVFLINPRFPGNILLLKGVSMAAMIGAGFLTYRFGTRHRHHRRSVAAAVALSTVITPSLVFLATSTLMSEGAFLFVQLAALLLVERAAHSPSRPGRWAVAAGVLAAAAFLVRTAGVTVVVAGVLYLAGRRRWRAAALFGAAALLCALPWSFYARTHAASRTQLVDHGGAMAEDYTNWFWTSEAGTVTARRVGLGHLPARITRNVTNIAIRDMGGIFVPLLFRTPSESGLEVVGLGPPEGGKVPSMGAASGTKIISFALSVLAVIGFVVACRTRVTVAEPLVALSVVMIALWPFWTFRFVLPLTPFLLSYFVLGVEALVSAVGPSSSAGRVLRPGPLPGLKPRPTAIEQTNPRLNLAPQSAVRMFLLVLIGLNVLDHGQYIAQAYGRARGAPWKDHAADVNLVLGWLQQHADGDGAVAADNPALVYLRTGRPTVSIHSFDDRWSRWERMGVRYLVSLSDGELPDEPHRYAMRFKLEDKNLWVVELLQADARTSRPDAGGVSVGGFDDPHARSLGPEGDAVR